MILPVYVLLIVHLYAEGSEGDVIVELTFFSHRYSSCCVAWVARSLPVT